MQIIGTWAKDFDEKEKKKISSTNEINVEIASLYIGIRVPQKFCSTVYLYLCGLLLSLSVDAVLSLRCKIHLKQSLKQNIATFVAEKKFFQPMDCPF